MNHVLYVVAENLCTTDHTKLLTALHYICGIIASYCCYWIVNLGGNLYVTLKLSLVGNKYSDT